MLSNSLKKHIIKTSIKSPTGPKISEPAFNQKMLSNTFSDQSVHHNHYE